MSLAPMSVECKLECTRKVRAIYMIVCIACSALEFWWCAPTPENDCNCFFLEHSRQYSSDEKIPLLPWKCFTSMQAMSYSPCSKRSLPMMVSLAPRDTWFSTQISPDAALLYCPTMKPTIATLMTIATGKPTRSPTNKLICRHKIPNFQPVGTNGSLRIKIWLNILNFGRSLLSPSQLTRLTLWNCTRRCRGKLGFYDGWMTLQPAKWVLEDLILHNCL